MSEVLDALYAVSAFKPQPGRALLGLMHVPFDTLTGHDTCEARTAAALAGHRRVVVAGGMGTGKSSLIEWVVDLARGGTLRPGVEGYLPIRVPLRVDSPEVATQRGAFLGHLAALRIRTHGCTWSLLPTWPMSHRLPTNDCTRTLGS